MIRLAVQLISPPKRPLPKAPPEVWQGPATPPLEGFKRKFLAVKKKGHSEHFLLDAAWTWRNTHVKPVVEIPVRVPPESQLLEMERVAPNVAAHYRRQIAETIAGNKRMKLTRTIARIQQLIVDQYGWPERD